MKQKTNGKIIVAILVMFAVAVSIIGFTYAFFTATFNDNENDESVTVIAGKLMANYVGNKAIKVSNVVPGWLSDGLSYYDPVLAQSNNGNVFASHLRPRDFVNPKAGQDGQPAVLAANASTLYYGATEQEKSLMESSGLTAPIQFTVSNDPNSPDPVSFYIRLKDISNGLISRINASSEAVPYDKKLNYVSDLVNFKVHLYEGTFNYENVVDPNNPTDVNIAKPYNGTLISTLILGYGIESGVVSEDAMAEGESKLYVKDATAQTVTLKKDLQSTQILSTGAHTLAECTGPKEARECGTDTTKSFFVIFEYEDAGVLQLAQGVGINAEVEIVGLQQNDGVWYNTDNIQVTFADSLHN